MLHITNGESAGNSIRQSRLSGEVLTWDDVLHEGPTPADLSLEQMSAVRAHFIATYYQLPSEEVMQDFLRRDTTLTHFREHEEVVLWFEHDLYDQLQLIQLLDWFAQQERGSTSLSLLCINTFPGVVPFFGLGQLTPEQLASLFEARQQITAEQCKVGRDAWQAYCSPAPGAIETLRRTDTSTLPFLNQAFLRHLEEFPALENGLSRTERQILEIIVSGTQKPAQLFRATMEKEEGAFMGDVTFWLHLVHLCQGARPLLRRIDGAPFIFPVQGVYDETFHEQILVLTEDGSAVLENRADWVTLCQGIDRWLGGVHLHGQNATWRWDRQRQILVQRYRC
jgi:hypothetical protein